MWVIVENLRAYLDSDKIRVVANGGNTTISVEEKPTMQVPLYLGCRFAESGDPNEIYNTGGPGYTLNKAALKKFVTEGLPHHFVGLYKPSEDVFAARTMRAINISTYNTRDEVGSERYVATLQSMLYYVALLLL